MKLDPEQECYDSTGEHIGDDTWITTAPWPSREIADEKGREAEAWGIAEHGYRILEYVEALFFPEEESGS